MAIDDEVGLIERCAAPEVDENQDFILVLESVDRLEHFRPQIIRTFAWLQCDSSDVFLLTEEHASGHENAFRKIPVSSEKNTYHLLFLPFFIDSVIWCYCTKYP